MLFAFLLFSFFLVEGDGPMLGGLFVGVEVGVTRDSASLLSLFSFC